MEISLEPSHTIDVDYHELCGALAARDMQPLWKQARSLVPEVPLPTVRPWLWKWDVILPLAQRAGEVVTIERGGDRRVLALANPGLAGLPFTCSTLWGGVQFLGGGESAPAHRHTPGAIRFVMTGHGAITTVNGEECVMEPGDLVLTPSWHWHEHHNRGDGPAVWFDGLDLPLTTALDAIFFENHPDHYQQTHGREDSMLSFPAVGLAVTGSPDAGRQPMRYAWADMDHALGLLVAQQPAAPMVSLTYINPATGGSVLPTLGCEMHRLLPNGRTTAKRHTGNSIFVAFRGGGTSVINGEALSWGAGDIFVAPSWSTVDHEAAEPSDLFVVNDRPVLEALNLYRETTLPEPQEIHGSFSGSTD